MASDHSKAVLLLLVMVHVDACCVVESVPYTFVVTCWERADLLAVVFVVSCLFPKCILAHIRIKDKIGAVKLV